MRNDIYGIRNTQSDFFDYRRNNECRVFGRDLQPLLQFQDGLELGGVRGDLGERADALACFGKQPALFIAVDDHAGVVDVGRMVGFVAHRPDSQPGEAVEHGGVGYSARLHFHGQGIEVVGQPALLLPGGDDLVAADQAAGVDPGRGIRPLEGGGDGLGFLQDGRVGGEVAVIVHPVVGTVVDHPQIDEILFVVDPEIVGHDPVCQHNIADFQAWVNGSGRAAADQQVDSMHVDEVLAGSRSLHLAHPHFGQGHFLPGVAPMVEASLEVLAGLLDIHDLQQGVDLVPDGDDAGVFDRFHVLSGG
ncbi:MAG: hypothetical protein PVF83_07095 [Anaerolineales bacterium]